MELLLVGTFLLLVVTLVQTRKLRLVQEARRKHNRLPR